ncbi:MAG: hypothetical protein JXJ04_05520 [Spirochaetales bacterium]|nr:hypothetical protein [Spirochaetales bacterium]
MSINFIHDFHFILAKGMKEKLQNLRIFDTSKSLSGVMVKILKILTPAFGKEHKWGKQRMSKYLAVSEDPGEIREHVHAYIPDKLYRELKLLHQDLNFYSIAQLMRGFFSFFLVLVDAFKDVDEVIKELEKIFTRWKSEDEQTRLTSRKFMRQLWKIIRFLPGKNRLVTIYDENYSPFWVQRI